MVSRKVVISNPTGLHVRPAGILVKAADHCGSRVELISGNSIANCRSILNVLSMAVRCGDEVEICCTGPTEVQDLEYMVHVIKEELGK